MNSLVAAFLPATILLALIALPMVLVTLTMLSLKRLEKRDKRRSPLTDKLLHQPGAQARERFNELGDEIVARLIQILVIGPLAMLAMLLPRVDWSAIRFSWTDWLVSLGAAAWIAWLLRALVKLRDQRLKWREGMRAEMATAQELDRLRELGCAVYHDLPAGKDFNIDHVVVGPSAVYMIETKSRRKPDKGRTNAIVRYDGKKLGFPGWSETRPLEQARAQARWLSDWLFAETGDRTPVVPVVCLPGWYVELGKDAHGGDVKVINPKLRTLFAEKGSRPPFEASHRIRITTQLQKRYPETSD